MRSGVNFRRHWEAVTPIRVSFQVDGFNVHAYTLDGEEIVDVLLNKTTGDRKLQPCVGARSDHKRADIGGAHLKFLDPQGLGK
jgi:hypothetical protein